MSELLNLTGLCESHQVVVGRVHLTQVAYCLQALATYGFRAFLGRNWGCHLEVDALKASAIEVEILVYFPVALDFRSYAAASSQASRMAWISWGVGWSGRVALNLAVMRTRRRVAAMSLVDGSALVVYQGAFARRSCR